MGVAEKDGAPVKCDCGKMIARIRNGKLYVWCKACRKEVEIQIHCSLKDS